MKRLVSLLLALLLLLGQWTVPFAPSWEGGAGVASADTLIASSKKKKPKATPTAKPTGTLAPTQTPQGPITDPQGIADYLFTFGCLPENFLTKKEAKALGWDSMKNYVSDVAPGMSIGGDYFGNYEEILPVAKGRSYYECDCYYVRGKRNAYRVIFSTDGHVYFTEDHYATFQELSPSEGIEPVTEMSPKANGTRGP